MGEVEAEILAYVNHELAVELGNDSPFPTVGSFMSFVQSQLGWNDPDVLKLGYLLEKVGVDPWC